MKFTDKQIEKIEDLGYKVYHNYSGRFMFGEKCDGIIIHDTGDIAEIADAKIRGLGKLLKNHKMDNLGMNYIIY